MAPLALPPGHSSWQILALGVVVDIWLHSSGLAEPFYPLLQYGSSHQGLPMGLAGLGKFSLTQSVLPFSLEGSVAMAGWMSAGGLSSLLPPDCSPLLHLRQSFKEDKMSLVTSHAHLGPHRGVWATS